MNRDISFDKNAVCDGCGAVGAFDFMGDFFCQKCLAEEDSAALQSLAANARLACEGTGNMAVHGLDPTPCSACNGTGKR